MKRIAVLISGRGSNMEAIAQSLAEGEPRAQISLVISNRPYAEGLERAAARGLRSLVVDHTKFPSRSAFDDALAGAIEDCGADLVLLAGFMRVLTDGFVRRFEGRLINIHPSLLPAFKGTRVHEAVIAAGVAISGASVHFVVPEIDAGPIIGQAAVPVLAQDTPQTLAARIARAEHRLYPACLKLLLEGAVRLEGGRAHFAGGARPALWQED